MHTSDQIFYFLSRCYDDVINKAKNFKSNTSKVVKSLKNIICKDCDLVTILYSLMQVYFAINIGNLLVQLVGLTSN